MCFWKFLGFFHSLYKNVHKKLWLTRQNNVCYSQFHGLFVQVHVSGPDKPLQKRDGHEPGAGTHCDSKTKSWQRNFLRIPCQSRDILRSGDSRGRGRSVPDPRRSVIQQRPHWSIIIPRWCRHGGQLSFPRRRWSGVEFHPHRWAERRFGRTTPRSHARLSGRCQWRHARPLMAALHWYIRCFERLHFFIFFHSIHRKLFLTRPLLLLLFFLFFKKINSFRSHSGFRLCHGCICSPLNQAIKWWLIVLITD